MTQRKITIDNCVKYIPKSEQTREFKQNTMKIKSTPRKHNKNISQNNEKILINVAAHGFGSLKSIMNCYFQLKSILIN